MLAELITRLSATARRNRFLGFAHLSATQLDQMGSVDFRRQLALVATIQVQGAERVIADARYGVDEDGETAEFALVVDEQWQRQGVATRALRLLTRAALKEGVRYLRGEVLHTNVPMLTMLQRSGFSLSPDPEDRSVIQAFKQLKEADGEEPPARPGRLAWQAWRRPLPEAL